MKKMKLSIKYITCIIFAFALYTCSANKDEPECLYPEYFDFDESLLAELGISFQKVCHCVTDAVKFPEPMTADFVRNFEASDKTISSMSTCGLLIILLKSPEQKFPSSSEAYIEFSERYITEYNDVIRANKMAVEFFNRSDFYPVLVNKYLSVIKASKYDGQYKISSDEPYFLELLLSSDMCISALSENEKIQLMAMALERTKYAVDFEKNTSCYIMIAIMKSYKYTPFMEINPSNYHRDIIIEYASQFLNEQEL